MLESGIQGPDDVIVTRGDTLHWVRGLGFSTHFSWNFGTFDCDQVEASMARYRENESITKTRNDQFPYRSGGFIPKREKMNRDKSSKPQGRDIRGAVDDDAKVGSRGSGSGSGSHYRYRPSPVQAFQSLVPMKTLILDLVRELLHAGKEGAAAGGGGGVAGGAAVEASIHTDSYTADTMNGSWSNREAFNFTTTPPPHRRMTSAVAEHLQQVLKDSPLLVTLLLELTTSVQQMRKDVSIALSVTSLKPFMEPYGSSNLHCERSSCSMELFEAYIECPKCGIICLQCASGCGEAFKGGCVEEERVSPETVPFLPQAVPRNLDLCTPSPNTKVASTFKIGSDVTESAFRPVSPLTAGGHAKIANLHPLRADMRAVKEPACALSALSSPPHYPCPCPCPSDVKEDQPTPAQVAHVRVLHVHYPGARMLLKTPLTALSKIVKDFAALIVQLHPEEEERIRMSPVAHP